MAAPAYCLGITVEPTRVSFILVDQGSSSVAELDRAHGVALDSDPADWWRACRTGIKDLLRRAGISAGAIRAIGLSGDASVLVTSDKTGKSLSPVTFAADARALPGIDQILGLVGARNLMNLTGRHPTISSPLTKLQHLRTTSKRAWHDASRIVSAKDWIRLRLTGEAITDAAEASTSLLFNPKTRTWSKQLLTALDIDAGLVPHIMSGEAISGRVSELAAKETGLQIGTPVVTGAGHAAAVLIAAGVLAPGTMVVELGRGGCIAGLVAEHTRSSDVLASGCHALDGYLRCAFGADGLAAAVWVMNRFASAGDSAAKRAKAESAEALIEQAAEVPAGSEGLLFVPSHDGRSAALGDFHGLGPAHHRGHMLRACLESGALRARQAMAELGATEIVAIGPGAAMPFWTQLLADACNAPVYPVHTAQAASTGVAILAASAVGIHKGPVEAMAKMVKRRAAVAPRRLGAEAHAKQAEMLATLRRPVSEAQA